MKKLTEAQDATLNDMFYQLGCECGYVDVQSTNSLDEDKDYGYIVYVEPGYIDDIRSINDLAEFVSETMCAPIEYKDDFIFDTIDDAETAAAHNVVLAQHGKAIDYCEKRYRKVPSVEPDFVAYQITVWDLSCDVCIGTCSLDYETVR